MADLFREGSTEQYQQMLAAKKLTMGIDPNKAAETRKTAKQLGVPDKAVWAAPEFAALEASFQRVWRETEGHGTLRGKMTDPDFHALAQDDVGTLAKIGGVARSFADGAVEGVGGMVSGTGEILSSGWNAFTHGMVKMLLKPPEGREHETIRYGGPNGFAPGWRFYGGEVKDFSNKYIDIPDGQKTYANEVSGGLGQLLTQAGVYLATGSLGALVSGGAMSADQMAEEVRNDDAPQINKDLAVLGSASFTAVSEKIPLGKITKGWRAGAAGHVGTGAAAKRIFMGGAAEAVQEGAESVVNDALRKNLTKPDHEISMANALHGASVGGGVGALATSLFEGAAGMRRAHVRRQQRQAEAQAEHLQAQSEQMAQSKLAARAPDVAAEYVNELYGEQGKIYIDGEALQQSGVAEKVAELMPQRAGEFAEAAATGGMIELTRGDFHTVLNQPDVQAALLPLVRATPDAMTLAEAQSLRESGEDVAMAAAVDEAAEAAQQQEVQEPTEAQQRQQAFAEVVGRVRQQLTDTGRYTPEQARINATLAGSYYQATADRMGVPVTELFSQRPLNVVGESLTQPGVLSQALAANPPRGWVYASNPQDAVRIWTENGSEAATNQAVFWTLENTADTGLPDTAGYSHSISRSAAYHIYKEHGDAESEAARGQIAVEAQDLARIPDIVTAPDEVVTGFQSEQGAERVAYLKRFDDALVVYVAEASRKKKDFRAISMRKYPPTAISENVVKNITSQSLNVRNGEGAYGNDTADTDGNQDVLRQSDTLPRGMFDPASDTIAVLRNADASTFAHELGHFFLEMHTELALQLQGRVDLTAAQQQLVRDMQTVMDWFGVADVAAWRAMTLPEQREKHEQFARGFEAYLYEGKAPSTALRDVFRRFAAWLQHVYRSLTALNVELTDDVRAVYGRMLASDAQVEQSEYTHGMKPMFDTAEAMGVDADSFAAYQETQAEAQAQAREALQGRALRDLAFVRNMRNRVIRKLKKQHKADFDRAEMDARRSIMRQPVYRAWQLLTARMDAANRIDDSKEQREFRRKAKVLQGAPVFEVRQRQAPHGYPELREWASKLFMEAGGKAVNPELGEVVLNARSVKDSMGHGMNPFKAEAFAAVPSVIEQGVVIHEGINAESQMRYAYISAPVRIDGTDDVVTVLVRTDKNTQRMYIHSVATKESILNAGDSEASAQQLQNGKVSSGYIANILRRYLTVNTGKPKVQLDNTTDSLFTAIAKLGGLNREELAAQWGLDAKEKVPAPVFGMPVLRRSKGKSLDAMLEVLAEEGYVPLDNHGKADVRDLEERFFDELRGTPRYSSAYVPRADKKAGDDVPNLFALTAARLDYASLQEMGFNAQALAVLQERGMVLKSGGLHPDFAAALVRDENGLPEFATGEDLVLAVLQAEPPQEAIEQTAYLNVLAEKGEVPMQADFEQAADLAAHNDLRARVLAAEFKALSDAVGSVSLIKRAAQSYARDKVDGITLSELRPHRYTQAEARAAKLAEKALAKGDTAQAAGYKRSQLVQNALARAALEARDHARKQKRELSDIGRRTIKKTAKGYDADLMSAAKSVVGMFGIAPRSAEYAAAYLENVQKYNPEAYSLAVGVLSRAQELAYKAEGRFDNLTVAEAQGLYDDIQALRHLAKTAHDAVVDGRRADMRDIQAALRERMEKLPQRFKEMGRKRAPTDAEKNLWDFYQTGAALRRVESWAEAMDGGFGGVFSRYVFQPIKEASDNYRDDKALYLKKFRDIVQNVKFGRAQIAAPELGYTFKSHNELMHALLHTGNASNKRKLLVGRRWGHLNEDGSLNTARWDAFIARMMGEGKLTKRHFDVAQQIWDLLEELKPKAQAAHHAVYGYYFEEITAEPFQTPWGEYRGGYIPAVKDGMLDTKADIRSLEEVAQENVQGMFPTTNKGFTKNRVEGADDPLLLDLGTLGGHIDKVLRFSHLEVPLRQVKRTLMGIEVEIEQVSPGAVGGMLVPWLHRVSTQQVATRGVKDGGFSKFLTELRNRAGMAAMVMNMPNAAQQLAGFPLATAKVKPRYLLSAMADYVLSPLRMSRAVSGASKYMDARLHNQIGLMTEQIERILIDPNWFQRLNQWSQDKAYFAQSAVDNAMAPVIWMGAYNQATEQGMSHKDAVRFADGVIRETQGSVLVEDVSRIETGHPFFRLFTQFYGYFNMLGNLMLTETLNIKRHTRGWDRVSKLAYLWGVAYYGTAVVAELMMGLMRGGYDDEDGDGELDDRLREVLLLSPVKTGIGMVPQLGNAWNIFVDDKPYNDRGLSAPAVSLAESASRAIKRGRDVEKHSDVRDIGSLLALFGMPWGPALARPAGYVTGVASGDIRPTGPVDAVRGTLTGVASGDIRPTGPVDAVRGTLTGVPSAESRK